MTNETLGDLLKNGRSAAPHEAILSGVRHRIRARRIRRSAATLCGTLALAFAFTVLPFRAPRAAVDAVFAPVDAAAFFSQDTALFCLPGYGATLSLLFNDETADTASALMTIQETDLYPVNL
ncbi:MAG: hypothetical protein V1913_13960 [Fibrobacterota bacterium]